MGVRCPLVGPWLAAKVNSRQGPSGGTMFRWLAARPLLVALGATSTAMGQTLGPPAENPVEFVHVKLNVDVNADGTYTQTVDQLLLIKTQQGVQAATTALV